jgi:hypothetical protein
MLGPKTVEPRAQSTYIYRVQSNAWRLPNYWPPAPSPPSECVLPPRQRRERHTRRAGWGGGGSIFRKTPDIGLTSYSIIPLRPRATCPCWTKRVPIWVWKENYGKAAGKPPNYQYKTLCVWQLMIAGEWGDVVVRMQYTSAFFMSKVGYGKHT